MKNAGKPVRRTVKSAEETKETEELRQARQELERQVAQLRAILDSLTEGVVVSDLEGQLFHWNPAAIAMHGFVSLEECRRKLPQLVETFELTTVEEGVLPLEKWPLARILHGETLCDWEVGVRRRGTEWQRVFSYGGTLARDKDGQPLLAVVTVNDVTERKRAEAALREATEKLHFALDSAQLGTVEFQTATGEVSWDERSRVLFGLPAGEELPYAEALQLIHREDRQRVDQQVQAALAPQGDGNFAAEYRIILPDGTVHWVITKGRVSYAGEGTERHAVRISGVHLDITKFKQMEEELENYRRRLEEMVVQRTAEFAEANEKLAEEIAAQEKTEAALTLRATILDKAGAAIFLINPRGDFVYVNDAASRVYGYSADEFLAMNLRELLREEAAVVEGRLQEISEQGHLAMETVHLRKDGAALPVQVRYDLIKTRHGAFIVSVIQDLRRKP